MFKYELHLHTSDCSACGVSNPENLILRAKELGYSGIVLTDHFYRGNTRINRGLSWVDFVSAYEESWLKAKEFGSSLDMDVIFGIEEVYILGSGKEVLIYGVTPEELKAETDFKEYSLKEICDFAHRCGGFVSLAHPFRADSYIADPDWLPEPVPTDGIEIYNGSFESEHRQNRNCLAEKLAKSNGLKPTSGGDIHGTKAWTTAISGIAVDERIHDTKELSKVLHSGNYRLIINGQTV